MNIGLMDIDGKNFPNLALMKLSSYYKQQGHNVEFVDPLFGNYDIVYKSKVFTYTPDDNIEIKSKQIVKGGTGYKLYDTLPDEIEHTIPDYSLYNCESAYGFLTRGCIRNCSWCVVPTKEGKLKPHADITEFIGDKKSAILLDNNVLASDYGLKQIEKIIDMKIKIDFNQGLDARLIANNEDIAKLLSKVKWFAPLRMACDTLDMMPYVEKATMLLRKHGCKPQQYFCYVLVKDIYDAMQRVELLRSLNVSPFAQPFRNFETNTVDKEAAQFAMWVNIKQCFKSMPYKNFNNYTRAHSKEFNQYNMYKEY